MTGEASSDWAGRIERRVGERSARLEGRCRINALQPRRSMREPRAPLFAAALNPKCGIGFVHPNVAGTVFDEDGRHALAGQFAAVRRPGERPAGTLATSVLGTRSTLLTADLIAGRERPDSRHATHRTESRLAHRVDAGAEAADVAASATVIRVGCRVSTARVGRWGDGVGAHVHGRVEHCGVRRATNTSHALIRRDRARRTDVARASSRPDATLVVVVSTRGHERHTNQDCGREKTTLNRDAHADFPPRKPFHARRNAATTPSLGAGSGT